MNIYLKNIEILIVIFVYLVFFCIGLLSFRDFGISIDEWELRIHGFVNLKYLMEIFYSSKVSELDKILQIPEFTSYYGTHGAFFPLITSLIEYIFEIKNEKNYYFITHYLVHFIFLISNFYFFY